MQKFSLALGVGVVCVLMSACQVIGKRDNGSLDYAKAKKLPPIELPAHQATMPFVPLYAVPDTTGLTPITNDSGKQYQLPKPPQAIK